MARYVKVAKLDDLPPGSCREFQADGKPVALFNVDGKVYCLDNTCLHRGGPLGQGVLEDKLITCPWHGWQYDVTTGAAVMNAAIQVRKFDVKVEGDDIQVDVEG